MWNLFELILKRGTWTVYLFSSPVDVVVPKGIVALLVLAVVLAWAYLLTKIMLPLISYFPQHLQECPRAWCQGTWLQMTTSAWRPRRGRAQPWSICSKSRLTTTTTNLTTTVTSIRSSRRSRKLSKTVKCLNRNLDSCINKYEVKSFSLLCLVYNGGLDGMGWS